ncbi:MAG: Gldg family protein [Candidatus Aminicenantes bacterium]|nr:Gldg family protein [Candidatus Aminicenantes bacterium]
MNDNKNKYYKFGLYLIMLLLINVAAGSMYFRLDLTSNGLYSLSDASEDAVNSLTEPLTINVFFSKNLPSPYNNVERYLHDILEEYEIHSNKNLSFRFYDVNAKEGDLSEQAEENRKIANSYGIYPVNVQKIEQDEAKIQKAYMGMVFIHGDIVEKIPAVISTEDLEYKITTTIQKMNNKISALLKLKENIKLYLLNSSSLSSIAPLIKLKDLDKIEARIVSIIEKVNNKVYGKLELKSYDPSSDNVPEKVISGFKHMGIEWPELKSPEGKIVKPGKGVIAIGLEYDGISVQKNLMSKKLNLTNRGIQEEYFIIGDEEIETFINDNIDKVININEDIGYLTSNGTLSISAQAPPQMQMFQQQPQSEISNFKTLVNKEYTLKEVSLEDGGRIPDSIDTLIVAGPTQNFSDWELFMIDQFLMKGGSLAVMIDPFKEIQQQQSQQMYGYRQPVYMPLNTGIDKLISHYGITLKKVYLLDESCYINRDQNNNEMPIYFAPVIKNENINHKFGFLKNIKHLVAIKISPIEIEKKEGIKYSKVFSSSDKAWEMKGKINLMPMMIKPPESDEEKSKMDLAYIAEGKFTSYFADKDIPEQPLKEEKKDDAEDNKKVEKLIKNEFVSTSEILKAGKSARIFVIGSSEIIKNNLVDENGLSPNSTFILNIIDYLNGKEKTAEMRGKKQKFNPVSDTKSFTRTSIKVLNIAGLPLGFVIFGIVVWIRRNNRKRKIFTIFNSEDK